MLGYNSGVARREHQQHPTLLLLGDSGASVEFDVNVT